MGYAKLKKWGVALANGHRQSVSYVGPVEIHFGNRRSSTGAMVLGEEALLDALPMDDMDMVVSPAEQSVAVNPDDPNMPSVMPQSFGSQMIEASH